MKIKYLLYITLLLSIISCRPKIGANEPVIEVREVPEEGVVLNKWQLLGPLPLTNPENSININNLKCFGFKEDAVTYQDFLKIVKDTCLLDTTFTNRYIFSGATPIEFKNLSGMSERELSGDYYFACQIRCRRAISTRLHFSSNARAKIWLNNELFYCADYSLPIASYREFRPIELKEGNNFLLIKINRPKKGTEMYARLENKSSRALERAYGIFNHSILDGSVFIWGDTVKLNTRFPPSNGEIKIFDNHDNLLIRDSISKEESWSHSIAGFKEGDYLVNMKIGDITLEQYFYRGEVVDSIQEILKLLVPIEKSAQQKRNIDALAFRFQHLQNNTWWGDPKYVDLFMQVKDIYSNLKNGNNPFKHNSGCFIRSYISGIDSSQQYYILHVPSSYKRGVAIPTGVAVPVNVYDKFPYLQSFRVANSKLINFFQDLSEKYNMIIIEPGSRRKSKANYNPIEEMEFFSILNDVESDYNIDRNRIYLAGTCSGGNELIKMTVKYPDLFAAVGVVAPEIVYLGENANPWRKTNFPVMLLGNNIQLPIFDTHSVIDRHVPIESSENLKRIAEYYKLDNFYYVEIPNEYPKYYPDDFYDDIFKFTRSYTLNKSPKEVDLTTNQMLYNKSFWITITDMNIPGEAHIHAEIKRNKLSVDKENITAYSIDLTTLPYNKNKALKVVEDGKIVFNEITEDTVLHIGSKPKYGSLRKNSSVAGPLAHVFTQSFIVVKGTSGNQKENESISALAETINKYWNERYFVDCRIKNDYEITDNDIMNSSLVLLGNPESNKVIKEIINDIPLEVSPNRITIHDEENLGNELCFYMVYPNPKNNKRYVAIIGYNNSGFISLGAEVSGTFNDVSNYGWYDYKVWGNTPNLVLKKGYFDSSWELQKTFEE